MSGKHKNVLRILVCVVITFSVYICMCIVVTPKDISNSGGPLYYRGMGFLSEPDNTIDVMVYGNSDVYSGFVPARLFDEYGYSAYASGRANQTAGEIVKLLEKTLITQNPEVVILETDCFFTKKKRVNLDTGNILLAPFIYHSRWKEISLRDFTDIPDRNNFNDINRGFLPSELTFRTDSFGDYMKEGSGKSEKITDKNREAVETFVKICNERNVKVVFLELPSPSSWNYGKHTEVKNLAEKLKVEFVDLNIPSESYSVNCDSDFRDNGNHMNTSGACRATDYIGKYLADRHGDILKDRRITE